MSFIQRFVTHRGGNLGVVFAVAMVPLALAVGMAVEYTQLTEKRSSLQQALDAGTMAAAIHYTEHGDEEEARIEALGVFNTNCSGRPCSTAVAPQFDIEPGKLVTGRFAGTVEPTFMKLAGVTASEISVASQVGLGSLYEEFHFAIDRSASLGIAADEENRALMQAMTKPYFRSPEWRVNDGCSFACHEPMGVEPRTSDRERRNFYDMAIEQGIKLREDVLLDALDNSLDVILERITGTHADQIRVAAYTFSDELDVVSKPTANSTNLKTKIRKSGIRSWGTRLELTMPKLSRIVGRSGTGSSRSNPRKTLVLITDGMMTNYWDDTIDRIDVFRPMDARLCNAFKDNGVRVVVVDVKYPRLPDEPYYVELAGPHVDDISPALEACASPGFYYTADDTPQIQATLIKMANDARKASLTFVK